MSGWDRLVAGRYRLRDQLGAGGMGRVWLARDEVLRRDVAIKEVVFPHGLTAEEYEELRLRTMREARAAARLNHPNVIGVHDVVEVGRRPWIVMEYVPSRSLFDIIRKDGPLPPDRAATIGLALLAALQAAHSAGVLHRDVKPGNVLLAEDGRVVLSDFGLASFDTGEGAVTRPGLVLGSPQYVAPERARDGISSPEADLWSLGATLYAAVEGHAPYARASAMATLTALATEPPRPPVRAGPLRAVLDGLLQKDPRTRLQPAQVKVMLQRAAAGRGSAPRRLPIPGGVRRLPLRHRLMWTLAGIGCVALVGSAVLALRPSRDTGAPPSSLVSTSDAVVTPRLGVPDCAPAQSLPAVTPRTHRFAPLPGWRWHDDPGRFSVVVPADWTYARSGTLVCFRSPAGDRVLGIESWAQDDLSGYWVRREAQLTEQGRLPGFTRIRIGPRDYWRNCTTWEFSYDGPGGGRVHEAAWAFQTAPGRSFAIYWSTPESDWSANLDYHSLVTASFTPY